MRHVFEAREEDTLSSLAIKSKYSKGRKHNEPIALTRTCFQRDRDRVIHSKAFRRLKHKTQVFISTEADHYRTRLTHTLEVAQLARHISRLLNLNEDLAETIALAHDLGHTPFGHSGERALNELMKEDGGFEHNSQSLRIVDILEKKNPLYEGLNLSLEVRHGLLKHKKNIREFKEPHFVTLESQLVNLSDEFAYHCHDIDDGISAKIIDMNDLKSNVTLYNDCYKLVKKEYVSVSDNKLIAMIHSQLLTCLISNSVHTTKKNINSLGLLTVKDIQSTSIQIVDVDTELREKVQELKTYLFKVLYKHKSITDMNTKGQNIIECLFQYYCNQPTFLKKQSNKRSISDYIAGMTDTFAQKEFKTIVA
jgi:dGTPase